MKICTEYNPKPGPGEHWDAWIDGKEEEVPVQTALTEMGALADLFEGYPRECAEALLFGGEGDNGIAYGSNARSGRSKKERDEVIAAMHNLLARIKGD